MMDSAGYGPFTITKAITVQAPPGVYAGISVFSGNGININAGASDTVILRGLTVNSQGGELGISFIAGGALQVESCVVNGFAADNNATGIAFLGAGNLEVKDSIVRNNTHGIFTKNSSGTVFATIDNTRFEGNSEGLFPAAGSLVTVRNSVASGNFEGFFVFSDNANATQLNVESCVIDNNVDGIFAERTSTGAVIVRISNSTVTNNAHVGLLIAVTSSPAVILSRGNNTVEGNLVADTGGGTIGTYSAK